VLQTYLDTASLLHGDFSLLSPLIGRVGGGAKTTTLPYQPSIPDPAEFSAHSADSGTAQAADSAILQFCGGSGRKRGVVVVVVVVVDDW
jgi:hypothetical protein